MKIFLLALAFLLASCSAGQYRTLERTTANGDIVTSSEFNSLSEFDLFGRKQIDQNGIYLNPFIEMNSTENSIRRLGFSVINIIAGEQGPSGIDQLGTLKEVTFHLDGDQAYSYKIVNPQIVAKRITNLNGYYSPISTYERWEMGEILLSLEEFKKISDSLSLSVSIQGQKQKALYEPVLIRKTFYENLKDFSQLDVFPKN